MRFICSLKNVLTSFPIPSQNSCLELNFLQGVTLRKTITGHLRKDQEMCSWPQCWAHSSALGSFSCQSADCACSSGSAGCWAWMCVFWQRFSGVFIFRIIASSRIATCSEQHPFFGPRGGKGRRKHIFLWQIFLWAFASLASFTWTFIPVYAAWHECLALIWGQTAP